MVLPCCLHLLGMSLPLYLDNSFLVSPDTLGECASVTVDVRALALVEAHHQTRGTLLISPLLCVLLLTVRWCSAALAADRFSSCKAFCRFITVDSVSHTTHCTRHLECLSIIYGSGRWWDATLTALHL